MMVGTVGVCPPPGGPGPPVRQAGGGGPKDRRPTASRISSSVTAPSSEGPPSPERSGPPPPGPIPGPIPGRISALSSRTHPPAPRPASPPPPRTGGPADPAGLPPRRCPSQRFPGCRLLSGGAPGICLPGLLLVLHYALPAPPPSSAPRSHGTRTQHLRRDTPRPCHGRTLSSDCRSASWRGGAGGPGGAVRVWHRAAPPPRTPWFRRLGGAGCGRRTDRADPTHSTGERAQLRRPGRVSSRISPPWICSPEAGPRSWPGGAPSSSRFPCSGTTWTTTTGSLREKLELLLRLRQSERVTWSGGHRSPLEDAGVYPRPVQEPIPVWVPVGGIPSRRSGPGRWDSPWRGHHRRNAGALRPLCPTPPGRGATGRGHGPASAQHQRHGYIADSGAQAGERSPSASHAAAMNRIGRGGGVASPSHGPTTRSRGSHRGAGCRWGAPTRSSRRSSSSTGSSATPGSSSSSRWGASPTRRCSGPSSCTGRRWRGGAAGVGERHKGRLRVIPRRRPPRSADGSAAPHSAPRASPSSLRRAVTAPAYAPPKRSHQSHPARWACTCSRRSGSSIPSR